MGGAPGFCSFRILILCRDHSIKRLHHELKKTFVFVTHDQEEAMTLATRIAVLREGELVQFDEPRTIYRRPATRFVAEFMGRPAMNVFDGHVMEGTFVADGFSIAVSDVVDGPVALGIRPEQVEIVDASAAGAIAFTVDVVELVEPDVLVFAKSGACSIVVRAPNDDRVFAHGQPIFLRFPPHALHAFDAVTGRRRP